jgi:predicted ester cyclase
MRDQPVSNHNAFAEPGMEGVKKVFAGIRAGVPDLKVFVEDVFVSADGSGVVGRYRYEGTHTGNFLGYPATGNAFAMRRSTSGGSRMDAS